MAFYSNSNANNKIDQPKINFHSTVSGETIVFSTSILPMTNLWTQFIPSLSKNSLCILGTSMHPLQIRIKKLISFQLTRVILLQVLLDDWLTRTNYVPIEDIRWKNLLNSGFNYRILHSDASANIIINKRSVKPR